MPFSRQLGPIRDPLVSSGVCQAWLNASTSGAGSIAGSFNIASITRNGTGDITVTFAQAFANANYAIGLGSIKTSGTSTNPFVLGTPTTTTIRLNVKNMSSTATDVDVLTMAVWGDI